MENTWDSRNDRLPIVCLPTYITWRMVVVYSESLAERIRMCVKRKRGIMEKKMFGGLGFLLHGNMLVGVWKTFLIARIGPDQGEAALQADYARPMDITGKPMKGWIMVDPEGVEDDDQLRKWIDCAINYVRTLPEK